MIKKKGIINVYEGSADINELQGAVDSLPDGEFGFLIYDNSKNRSLEMIIRHAADQWGITIPTREEIREAQAREPYAEAYAETWKFLSQN